MPAHQTLRAVGEIKLSNGLRLTSVDWRANRLVDALAKRAAMEVQEPRHALELVASGDAAALHAAALLGCVTHAANNHVVSVVEPDGSTIVRTMRDAVPKPANKKRANVAAARGAPVQPQPPQSCEGILPWTPLGRPHPARRRRPTAKQFEFRSSAAALDRRVAELGASLSTPPAAEPAQQRLEQLHARVKARLAAADT